MFGTVVSKKVNFSPNIRLLAPAVRSVLGTPKSANLTMKTGRHSNLSTATTNIRAVIFDMGGVLVTAPKIAWEDFERQQGIPINSILQAFLLPKLRPMGDALDCGVITAEEFEPEFTKIFGELHNRTFAEPLRFITDFEKLTAPVPVMINAVRSLRSRGYKTALLTNNFFIDKDRKHSVLPVDTSLFDFVIESCKIGLRKPDPEIYRLTLDKLQCAPAECAFLDDIGINVKAARDFGMHTIKVLPREPEKAVEELEKILGLSLRDRVGTAAVRKGLEIDTERLTSFIAQKLDVQITGLPVSVKQFKHGQSNPTYYVEIGNDRFVVRKKPPGKLLESAHMIEREYRVMKAVASHGVPVPKMLAFCEDPSVIGTPFYVMEYVEGRIFTDSMLPNLTPRQRREIFTSMNDVLCKIHSVDVDAADLGDYGKKGSYLERQMARWVKQYEASKTEDIPVMTKLTQWLQKNIPTNQRCALVHGDFRIDNLIYHPQKNEVAAVVDWELSTLGDPLIDLASCCLSYYLPRDSPIVQGFGDNVEELRSRGIPSVEEFVQKYCRRMNIDISPQEWNFYIAFTFFRLAAILQGVYKRHLQGQASSPLAKDAGRMVQVFAGLGVKQTEENRHFGIEKKESDEKLAGVVGHFATVPSALEPRAAGVYSQVKKFISENVIPLEKDLLEYSRSDKRWTPHAVIETLKGKAKAAGLWNLFIPKSLDPNSKFSPGFTNVEYAHMCELMGKCLWAPEVFNCSAPDTGNMEVLLKYGNQEQRAKWLTPLLEGTVRSCFAMTEPAVASSDATNIEASIVRQGDSYVLNGRKWYISGAMDPRCRVCIFMGKTDPSAPKHKQQSMIIVSMDTPGVTVKRALHALGFEDAPGGHAEIIFDNVVVPASNLIYGEGKGFEIAQGRLGPGRIHHCMRLIGHAEYALELMTKRALERTAFGKKLAEQGTVKADIAKSRIEIEQARLLVLKTAHMMDTIGNKKAAREIAMIKVVVPQMALAVLDRAIQIHGAAGVSGDNMLAAMYVWARSLRIADGPDEVHVAAVAKQEIMSHL